MNNLKIGISMRELHAASYPEIRDGIARDWIIFLNNLMPEAKYILLPNIEDKIIRYVREWGLNAFILTGGEDIGSSRERDNTESLIFNYAQKNSYPILGVCRGFQLIFNLLGGSIKVNDNIEHTEADEHKINYKGRNYSVSSYHSNILIEKSSPDCLEITSRCLIDQSIESYKGQNILGFMWHPERDKEYLRFDSVEIKKLFNYEM